MLESFKAYNFLHCFHNLESLSIYVHVMCIKVR